MSTSSDSMVLGARPWQSCGVAHVAVYGTLRAGGVNDIARLRDGLRMTGRTSLTGTLYDMGWYPGLGLHGSTQVLAEVYPLDADLEQMLDRYECVWPQDSGEYTKRILSVLVALPEGEAQTLAVLVYEALPNAIAGAPVIDAGDWLAWYAHHKTPLQNKK